MAQRVRWRCGKPDCDKGVHEGSTWSVHPVFKQAEETDYEYARRLGLTVDPLPGRDPVLVHFDDRPGSLQAHSRDELEFL